MNTPGCRALVLLAKRRWMRTTTRSSHITAGTTSRTFPLPFWLDIVSRRKQLRLLQQQYRATSSSSTDDTSSTSTATQKEDLSFDDKNSNCFYWWNEQEFQPQHIKKYRFEGQTTPQNPSGVTITFSSQQQQQHSLSTDLPKKQGGQDKEAQPVEHLLAAWAGCTQATALFVSRQIMSMTTTTIVGVNKKRVLVLLDRLEFDDIEAYRDERGALHLPIHEQPPVPSRLLALRGTIRVFMTAQPTSQQQAVVMTPNQLRMLQEQTELRCPVANMMLASGCRMDVTWVDGNAAGSSSCS